MRGHAEARCVNDHDADVPVDLETMLNSAYRRLGEACHEARRVLLDGQPGSLPSRWQCRQEDRWLLEDVQRAERDVDRLRRLARSAPAAAAARRASGSARGMLLDGAARREREAARLAGVTSGARTGRSA